MPDSTEYGLVTEPYDIIEALQINDIMGKEVLLKYMVITTWIYSLFMIIIGLIILTLKHFSSIDTSYLDTFRNILVSNSIINSIIMFFHNLTLSLSYFKPISDFIYVLNFHQLIDLYFSGTNILDISSLKIIGVIGLFITFSYLLVVIKEKGVLANEVVDSDYNNSINFLLIMIQYFAFYVIIFLVMAAFLLNQLKIFEFISYLVIIIYFMLSVAILLFTVSNLYSYKSLLYLNIEKTPLIIQLITFSKKQTLRNFLEGMSNRILRNILLSLFIWILIAYFLSFNIITVLFLVSALVISYYYISLIKHIPNSKANIILNNSANARYNDAFLTQDFPSKDYVEIITPYTRDNEQIKIMKSSIEQIKYDVFKNE